MVAMESSQQLLIMSCGHHVLREVEPWRFMMYFPTQQMAGDLHTRTSTCQLLQAGCLKRPVSKARFEFFVVCKSHLFIFSNHPVLFDKKRGGGYLQDAFLEKAEGLRYFNE
jgi:hypothetical protein